MMVDQNSMDVGVHTEALDTVSFECSDVTGTRKVSVSDVQPGLPAGAVAKSLASRMSLPDNVPWSLRDDAKGQYLDDDTAIGEQIRQTGAQVTLTPKAHLG